MFPPVHPTSVEEKEFLKEWAIEVFAANLLCSWVGVAATLSFSLLNGFPASLVWGSLFAAIGTMLIALSLAEMVAIDPRIGAQYRWTYRFAPKEWQSFLGYLQGWITIVAWISSCTSTPAIITNMIGGLVEFNHLAQILVGWECACIMAGVILLPLIAIVRFEKTVGPLEAIGFFIGVASVLLISLGLLILQKNKKSPEFVFQTLITSDEGWYNRLAAWSSGLLGSLFSLTGFDSVIHMAGDIKSPEDVLPHAMLKAVGFNGVIMFAFAVVLAFTIDDIKAVAASRLPIIQVFHQATGPSRISVNVMVSVLALVIFVAFINNFVSVSRLVHAFAEDNGLPFSSWLQVTQGGMPKNAIYCVTGCLLLLCLLNFSSVALNAFISLAAVALYISYFIPIILLSIKRYRSPDTIAWGKFRLGKWGLAVNVLAMLYILYCLVFMVLPATFPITSANFPYSSIIVSAIVLVATVFWRLGGNKKFTLYKKMT